MSTSDLIKPFHLGRLAIIYIRQSSPHQALTNQESTRLQYALKQRALELGWHEDQIRIIDEDQGRTASTTEGRHGLKELVTLVTLEHVGIIFSTEVTRLSRNCSDWYPLLDICGYRNCLIADRDGIHDPSTIDGRLLLGLKGQISELELHTIRGRLTAGILNKARRGELALTLPVGLIRDPLERVVKHPDVEVQGRIALIFETFLRVRSATQVVRSFNDDGLLIPRKDDLGDIAWRRPTVPAICSTLENPAYAGAFVYGRTRSVLKAGSTHERTQVRLPMGEWKIRINDKYPAYVDWATFETIQAMLRDNCSEYDRNKTRGVPRPGKALLHGIVHCGECGHQMVVQYKPKTHYICNFLRQQYQVPVCQYLPADPIDDFVVRAFFEALSPAELDLYDEAAAAIRHEAEAVDRARREQIDRLRYQARLAERQFTRTDPENRLVAAELERRWEAALRELQQAEASYQRALQDQGPAPTIPPELRRGLRTGRARPPGTLGPGSPHSAAEEVPAPLPDRQGRHPTYCPRLGRGADRLEGRRHDHREDPRDGELPGPPVVGPGDGGDDLELGPAGEDGSGDRRALDPAGPPLSEGSHRAGQHGPDHPPSPSNPRQAESIASATHPGPPHRVPGRREASGLEALDL